MNKSLILFLAVCLISAHAFVKRDAPETAPNNQLADFEKTVKETANKMAEAFSPDAVKNTLNEVLESIQNTLKKVQDNVKDAPKA